MNLYCVSHYGWYDERGFYDGHVGDGITRNDQRLIGVFNTKKGARFALKGEEEADERKDKRTRAMMVQQFEATDFATQQYCDNWGFDSATRMVVRDAAEKGKWHADLTPAEYLYQELGDEDEDEEDDDEEDEDEDEEDEDEDEEDEDEEDED
jgi:hypothetical protein